MRRRIFTSILLVSLAVLAASVALVMGVLYSSYSQQYAGALEDEANTLRQAADYAGMDYLETLDTPHRLTVISPDGAVQFDNVADPAQMENHLDRSEVQDAFRTGRGVSRRYSSTISETAVNVAVLLSTGDVLRISDTQPSFFAHLLSLSWQLGIILLLAVLLSFTLAYRLSRSITRPINAIDLESPDETAVYRELAPLVQRIRAQNEQIVQQMEALRVQHEAQDTMRQEFTANVSHELKTPLTSISGYAELIQNGLAKPEDVPRFAGKIYDESQRLITLVGDIIKLSQLDSKDIALTMEPLDLYDLASAVLSHLEPAAQQKNVTLSLSGSHAVIRGAGPIVEEMVYNLCDNAIKYNRSGGSVQVSVRPCVDGVELTVSDTGIGIATEDLAHIFERFYRVDKSHSKEIGGTGLGLSIVKHAARFHNAKVTVESTPGAGTTMRILF